MIYKTTSLKVIIKGETNLVFKKIKNQMLWNQHLKWFLCLCGTHKVSRAASVAAYFHQHVSRWRYVQRETQHSFFTTLSVTNGPEHYLFINFFPTFCPVIAVNRKKSLLFLVQAFIPHQNLIFGVQSSCDVNRFGDDLCSSYRATLDPRNCFSDYCPRCPSRYVDNHYFLGLVLVLL